MKDLSRLSIRVGDSMLTVVPAVHYRVAFAEVVNAISRDPKSRPELIAVESPPSLTLQIAQWLSGLGVSPKKRTALPCLLGLTARQRFVSSKLRDKAFALQLQYGCDLHELPGDVLERDLNLRRTRLAPLSPTDSIIEAIRCALELDVPVYGIDLEEHAAIETDGLVLPDVAMAGNGIVEYLEISSAHANSLTIGEVNERRELAMAARLKELLHNYPRVLFTCGLAHWKRIIDLIQEPSVRATTNVFSLALRRDTVPTSRTLIDASLAFQFLDRLPEVAARFERRRRHPLLDADRRRAKSISVPRVYDSVLRKGMRDYLQRKGIADTPRESPSRRINRLVEFPTRVSAYGALGLNEVPSVTQTLLSAKSFVSEDFAASLAKTLLRFRWAKPKDFPGCKVLRGAEHLHRKQNPLRIKRRGVLLEPMSIDGVDEPEWIGVGEVTSKEPEEREASKRVSERYKFTWTPWEHLITGLSDDAIISSLAREAPRIAEPFRGSASGKIAWKETLRARIRGDNELYVYNESTDEPLQPRDASEGWPVIWIFDAEDRGASTWKHYIVPMSWVTPYLDTATHQRLPSASPKNSLSTLICFGSEDDALGQESSGAYVESSILRGIVVYGPVFSLNQQYARWLELTNGLQNPCLRPSLSCVIPRPLARRCEDLGPALGTLRWQDDIIRLAIPYGRRQVTVVRPRGFRLDATVYAEAAQAGKRIALVDLERFAADEITRAQANLMVPGVADGDGPQYSANAEAAIAEDRLRYAKRMPEKWMNFGL